MKKTIITSFIAGILVVVFIYHAYTVYQLKTALSQTFNIINQHDATLKEIVNLINESQKK